MHWAKFPWSGRRESHSNFEPCRLSTLARLQKVLTCSPCAFYRVCSYFDCRAAQWPQRNFARTCVQEHKENINLQKRIGKCVSMGLVCDFVDASYLRMKWACIGVPECSDNHFPWNCKSPQGLENLVDSSRFRLRLGRIFRMRRFHPEFRLLVKSSLVRIIYGIFCHLLNRALAWILFLWKSNTHQPPGSRVQSQGVSPRSSGTARAMDAVFYILLLLVLVSSLSCEIGL